MFCPIKFNMEHEISLGALNIISAFKHKTSIIRLLYSRSKINAIFPIRANLKSLILEIDYAISATII